MKRIPVLLALSALAFATSAQSSLTIFGIADVAIGSYESRTDVLGSTINTRSRKVISSGNSASRIGFRGTEDLGGGLNAGFWLESPMNIDDGSGAIAFTRRATVSLVGKFGELRVGRDWTPTYWNNTLFDPFFTTGVGASLVFAATSYNTPFARANGFVADAAQVRTSNSVGYFLPRELGGVYGQLMYAFQESGSGPSTPPGAGTVFDNARVGRVAAARIGFSNGPLDVAVSHGWSTVFSDSATGAKGNLRIWNVGGTYNLAAFKLYGEYSSNRLRVSGSGALPLFLGGRRPGVDGFLVGASAPFGAFLVRAAFSKVKFRDVFSGAPTAGGSSAHKVSLGYIYNLSRRTQLYATAARVMNKNGPDLTVGNSPTFAAVSGGVADRSTGYELGIHHAF